MTSMSATSLILVVALWMGYSTAIPVPLPSGDDFSKVQVALYYESLCPSCRRFVGNVLPGVAEDLGSIMNLHLHPYGNAKYVSVRMTSSLNLVTGLMLLSTCYLDLSSFATTLQEHDS